jgi:hypothetical protein
MRTFYQKIKRREEDVDVVGKFRKIRKNIKKNIGKLS